MPTYCRYLKILPIDTLAEEEEKLKEIRLKIKDSPDHYAKSAENLNIEIIGMHNELRDYREEI